MLVASALDKAHETWTREILENCCPFGHVFSGCYDCVEYTKHAQVDECYGAGSNSSPCPGTSSPIPRSTGGGAKCQSIYLLKNLMERTKTQRTLAVIKALGAVAPAIVSRDVYYPGAKHLVPILQLLIPGIDLVSLWHCNPIFIHWLIILSQNDPAKTVGLRQALEHPITANLSDY